jgi:outer membrane protein assembly factor BamA
VKLTLNIEHRFKVYKYLDLATYIDAGNIWLLNSDSKTKRPGGQFLLNRFYRQLAVGTGLGFRFDFSFFIIRLDTGIPIFDPSKPEGLRWVISRLTFRDVNFLNLGIGYPF